MVQVIGTKGNAVQVEIFGIGEVMRQLQHANKQILQGADMGVVRAGTFIQEEVKESIIGNRPEKKSVDTGAFANSVEFKKNKKAQGVVKTDLSYAKYLEYGTSRIEPRLHFGNTKTRNQGKIKEIIENQIKKDLKV